MDSVAGEKSKGTAYIPSSQPMLGWKPSGSTTHHAEERPYHEEVI
jgi:hypothetical protein